jgi:hypothetical protein
MADSTYEYLLKGWLQTNRTEQHLLDMCKQFSLGKDPSLNVSQTWSRSRASSTT